MSTPSGLQFRSHKDRLTNTRAHHSYVDQPGSEYLNLTFAGENSAFLRVDTSNEDASTGRRSVRVESKKTYESGLFIFDIVHSPYGCGTWPALWLSDAANWPDNGEIDILEASNAAATGNQVTLHTTDGCSMGVKRKQEGSTLQEDCYNVTNGNAGCGVKGEPETYGEKFNDNGGGVSLILFSASLYWIYVLELRYLEL